VYGTMMTFHPVGVMDGKVPSVVEHTEGDS